MNKSHLIISKYIILLFLVSFSLALSNDDYISTSKRLINSLPLLENTPPGMVELALGDNHTCVLLDTGRVACWGDNGDFQLGYGFFNSGYMDTYSRIKPFYSEKVYEGAILVAAGGDRTCVVLDESHNGKLKCWGWMHQSEPAEDDGYESLQDIQKVSISQYNACVITSSGGVKCWGLHMLGDGINHEVNVDVPVDVIGLDSGISDISVGRFHTCVLTTEGGVKCWGDNSSGQLGFPPKNGHLDKP